MNVTITRTTRTPDTADAPSQIEHPSRAAPVKSKWTMTDSSDGATHVGNCRLQAETSDWTERLSGGCASQGASQLDRNEIASRDTSLREHLIRHLVHDALTRACYPLQPHRCAYDENTLILLGFNNSENTVLPTYSATFDRKAMDWSSEVPIELPGMDASSSACGRPKTF